MASVPTFLADWIVILPVLLCLGGAALGLVARRARRWQAWIAGLVLLAVLVCTGLLFDRVLTNGPLSMTMGNWLPPFGISFTADAMGAGFAMIAAFVGFAAVLYMQGDAPEAAVRDGLYPLMLLLVGGVIGAFLTGDLFNLYVWFEVMLIAALGLFVLAGRKLQLDAAVKYGILNFLATALFLAGLGLLYGLLGTLNMADIIDRARQADAAPLAAVAALLALAFGTKAALFPVNGWLPASYHAPPPVISALFGGLLTKVGVYAVLRTLGMLLPEAGAVLAPGVLAVAIATAILGPLSAIAETNLRRAIGFMLIGGVGVAVLGLPGGLPWALSGSVLYIFHSVLTMTALYLAAGLVERATGETDTRRMGGLYAAGSKLSLLFLVLVLGAAGLPPFLGFWPKLLLLRGTIEAGAWPQVLALLGNALLTLIAGSRLWSHIFWRGGGGAVAKVPGAMMAATVLLVGSIVMVGLWPGLAIKAAVAAAEGLLDPSRYILSVGLAP